MFHDTIADLLTRIRNASRAELQKVSVPHSVQKTNILKVLKRYGFISDFEIASEDQVKKNIIIKLSPERKTLNLKRVSSPGQRIFKKTSELKLVKNGLGIEILSTSKGIMSNVEAYKKNLGGEVICQIF